MSKPILKILVLLFLGVVLTGGPAGAAEGLSDQLARTGQAILEGAEAIYQDWQSGRKPRAAVSELFSFLEDKVRRFKERVGRQLRRPDLSPAEQKALAAAQVFLGHLERLMNVLGRLIQGDSSPELKRAYREIREKALGSLEELKESGRSDCLEA